ncbi:hypothetical protein ACRAWC_20480 [Leifsonia sp. L25]|uniref:hypothetical protein n=1 Tax=Leifsonia sp. L25 TaxID=3423957 RepID=UPI003D6944B8
MKILQTIAAEFRRLTASPMSIVALIALMRCSGAATAACTCGRTRTRTPNLDLHLTHAIVVDEPPARRSTVRR